MKGLKSLQVKAEAYLEPKRVSMMELFVNVVNNFTTFAMKAPS